MGRSLVEGFLIIGGPLVSVLATSLPPLLLSLQLQSARN